MIEELQAVLVFAGGLALLAVLATGFGYLSDRLTRPRCPRCRSSRTAPAGGWEIPAGQRWQCGCCEHFWYVREES